MLIWASLYRMLKNGQLVVNPAPVDPDTPNVPWLAQSAVQKAEELQAYGISAWLWGPLTMSQGGSAPNADGYGKAYDFNTGQHVNRPLRWGTAEMICDANFRLHELGILCLEDSVIHQMAGNPPFYELGPDGKTDHTLAPKDKWCFVPNVPVDNVFDLEGNSAFGQMVSFQHCIPAGYTQTVVIQAMLWRKKRFGLNGFRLDDTKGEAASVSQAIFAAIGGFSFGEMFDGDPAEEERWVLAVHGRSTLDFTLHWALQGICDGGVSLRSLPGNGLYARDSSHAILFVDSADTDNNGSQNIKFNKLWGYALITTLPAVGAEIYAGDCEKYGLWPYIRQMCWVSKMFAFGNLKWNLVEDNLIVWSRDGDGGSVGWSGGLLCGFNRDPIRAQNRWVPTPFGPGVHLHDYLGHGPDCWTNGDGWVNLQLGPNVNGTAQNVVMYAPAGVNHAFPVQPIAETMSGSLTDFTGIIRRTL